MQGHEKDGPVSGNATTPRRGSGRRGDVPRQEPTKRADVHRHGRVRRGTGTPRHRDELLREEHQKGTLNAVDNDNGCSGLWDYVTGQLIFKIKHNKHRNLILIMYYTFQIYPVSAADMSVPVPM